MSVLLRLPARPEQSGQPHHWVHVNPLSNHTYTIVDRLIRWEDGRKVRLSIAMDVVTDVLEAQREKSWPRPPQGQERISGPHEPTRSARP